MKELPRGVVRPEPVIRRGRARCGGREVTFIQSDDVVSAAFADEIERVMLSAEFPWYFYPNVNNEIPRGSGTVTRRA